MYTLIQMKKNKILKISSIFFLIFALLACSDKKETTEDDYVVDELSLNMVYSLLNKDYTLPTDYKMLKEDGWILVDNPDFVLEADQFIATQFIRNGAYILDVSFYNPSDESKTLENSIISRVGAENRTFGSDEASDIKVHGFVDFNTPIEDVIKRFDEYELQESSLFKTYIFKQDNLSKTEIRIDVDTNETQWIIIENFKID